MIRVELLHREMDPNAVKSTLSNLAFGNVMAAAARDYQKVPSLPVFFNLLCSIAFPTFKISIEQLHF